MTDTTDDRSTSNVVNFPRIGFSLTPTTTLQDVPPPPAEPPTAGTTGPGSPPGRRPPLAIVAALPDPGILQPAITPTAVPPAPGYVPDTFRAEPAGDLTGPRLGALSLAACLAVAVAALRGTHTVLSTWWETRQARQAETAPLREARLKHQAAMQQIADKAAAQHAKNGSKVPSSSDFGRKSLANRSGSGGGSGRGGAGSSKSGGSGSRSGGSGSGSGAKKQRGLFDSSGSGSGGGKGSGSGTGSWLGGGSAGRKRNNASGKNNTGLHNGKGGGGKHNSPKTPNTHTPKAPGPGGSRKNRAGWGGAGSSTANGGQHLNTKQHPHHGTGSNKRTSLAQATGKTLKKAAARRLKQRRKNLPTPTLWPAGQNTATNNPGNGKGPKSSKKTPRTNGAPGSSGSPAGAPNTTKPTTGQSKAGKPRKGTARTTLAAALRHGAYQAARRRLKQRRKNPTTPPIWSTHRRRKNTKNTTKAAGNKPGKPNNTHNPSTRRGPFTKGRTWWTKAAAHARRKASQAGCFNSTRKPGSGNTSGAGQRNANPGPGGYQRSTPFQTASQATAASQTTYTVQRDNAPGTNAKRWQPAPLTTGQPALPRTGPAPLPAAPTPHTARPGTTRPKEPIAMPPAPVPAHRPDPRIIKAKKQAARAAAHTVGRQMDAQHETEITLDDACDAADKLTERGFHTHDQSSKLSGRASKLRAAWLTLAGHCATDNNLIGDLFTAAALRFAESMELVDRMAQEMAATSLNAAEKAETAGNEINNAYRPYNIATADAGLTTPSAPIHNEA